jgi:hypothetical protein
MRTMLKMLRVVVTAAVGAVALGVIYTPVAAAGCALPDEKGGAVPYRSRPQIGSGAYRPASFLLAGQVHQGGEGDGIVGLWHVLLVSQGSQYIPDGALIDNAYVQWHSDGTELTNSSRPPATGAFCMGVWEKTGPSTYRLNHVALSWNPDGTFQGPASIRQEVTLDRKGDKYSGTFTIVQYDASGINVVVPTPIVGVLTAERITAH